MNSVTYEKSLRFSVRIVRLYQFLRSEKREYVMSRQLLRCGTSIGANISEAQNAISKNDFLNKMHISLKESPETMYWLDLLYQTDYVSPKQYQSIYTDCMELHRLLSSITKTTRESLE